MKKKKKNKKKVKKKIRKKKIIKNSIRKKYKKKIKKKNLNKKIRLLKNKIYKSRPKKSFLLDVIRFQQKFKPKFKIKIDIFNLDRAIQSFFQKIDNKIQEFKNLRSEEKQRIKVEEFERQEREKREEKEKKEAHENLILKIKEKELK